MADERRLSADEVEHRSFATSFRGLDANEVRAYLARVADELRAAADRESALATRLAEAEDRAAHPEIDEDTLLRLLGDETARVMRSAREAAADLRAHAEDNVEQILRDAHDEARRLRAAAESVLAERTAAAEQEAGAIRAAAEAQAVGMVESARAEAAAALDEVREQARAMVVEAQAARERILGDLNRRRRIAHVQVEQLRAGRDRLLEAYRMVRSTLEDVTDELQRAEQEARHAAEATARRLAGDDMGPEPADSEAEAVDSIGPPAAPVEPAGEPAADEPMLVTTTIEADSPAPVTAAPSRPASVPVEERRLSSLKLIRPEAPAEAEPEADPVLTSELDVVAPADPGEGVRVLAPANPAVEDLFARIRASRAEAVEEARAVLAEPEAEPQVEPQVEPEPEPAPAAADPDPEPAVSNEDERALQARDEAIAEIEVRLARKLKRSLQDEQNDLLDRLRSVRGKTAESVLPAEADHIARHAKVAVEFVRQAADGTDVDDLADALAESIVGPLRRQLERAVRPGHDDDDESAVANRVGAAYREWKGDRIERLAGDAVVAAWSRAWYARVPDGASVRWLVDDGGNACPDCDDNALAGPTAKGEEFPTGQTHPPAHAGCRCLLVQTAT
jgi:DivIVA domain-containing protein